MTNKISQDAADILDQLVHAVKQYFSESNVPVCAAYPDTGESVGIEKQAGENIVSQDMLGYTQRELTYEVTYKSERNTLPDLNGAAQFMSDYIDDNNLTSSNGSFEIVGNSSVTLPVQQGVDDTYLYCSFDITVVIETKY